MPNIGGSGGSPDALSTASAGRGDDGISLSGDSFSSGFARTNGNGLLTWDDDRKDRLCGGYNKNNSLIGNY